MKGEPIVGRRYVGIDRRGEVRGVYEGVYCDDFKSCPTAYRIVDKSGNEAAFLASELTPLRPKKPKLPDGWTATKVGPAFDYSNFRSTIRFHPEGGMVCTLLGHIDDFDTILKFLRRMLKHKMYK